jgi:hypothetical protein
VNSYTEVAKESETPRKAPVVRGRRQVKAGRNSEEDEKGKRGIPRNRKKAEDSIA